MKITKLRLENFLAHQSWEFGFESPLTIFVAPNGAGKSSVANAIQLGLEHTARGVTKKDRAQLGRGAEPYKVLGKFEHGGKSWDFKATPSTSSPSIGTLETILGPKDLVRCLTQWDMWAIRFTKDRREKLLHALGGAAIEPIDGLCRELNERRRQRGPASALAFATDKRREWNRVAKELAVPEKPDPHVNIAGKDLDLETLEMGKVMAALQDASGQRRQAHKDAARAASLKGEVRERIANLDHRAKSLGEYQRKGEAARDQLTKLESKRADLVRDRDKTKASVTEISSKISSRRRLVESGSCETCETQFDSKRKGEIESRIAHLQQQRAEGVGRLEALEAELDDSQQAIGKAHEDHAAWMARVKEAREAGEEARRLREQAGEAAAQGLNHEDAQAIVEALDTKVANYQELKAAKERYDIAIVRMKEDADRAERAKREVDEWARQEQIVKDEIETGGQDVRGMFLQWIGEFGAAWGRGDVDLDDDLVPRMGGRPFGLLSRAERYMCCVTVQAALAAVSGLRWFMADDLDVLVPTERKRFGSWLSEWSAQLDQVIAFAASESTFEKPAKNGVLEVRNL